MTVTKTSFPRASIHQLTGGTAWPSGVTAGDIVDVVASLGHAGSSMLVEGYLGQAVLRFNVCEKVFGRHQAGVTLGAVNNPYMDFYTYPAHSGEFEIQRDDITIDSGTNWFMDDLPFDDFKVVSLDTGVRITFK